MHWFLANNGFCFLVRSQAVKNRMADMIAPRPFTKRNFSHQYRLYPMSLLVDTARFNEGTALSSNLVKFRFKLAQRLIAESGAYISSILKIFILIVNAEQK